MTNALQATIQIVACSFFREYVAQSFYRISDRRYLPPTLLKVLQTLIGQKKGASLCSRCLNPAF